MSLSAFQNPLDDAGRAPDSRVTDSERIRSAIGDLTNAMGKPGVLWISRSAILGPTLSLMPPIPPYVTLAFAPGARLLLLSGAVLEVGGPLDAGLEWRFDVFAGARLALVGPLDEIHTAWWESGAADGSAVRHALDALWERYRRGVFVGPAPIVLDGTYALSEPLRVISPLDLTDTYDVVLLGRHFASADPVTFTLAADVGARTVRSLLAVDGRVVLTLEHVGFDLTPAPGGRAALEAVSLAGDHDRSRVEACYFKLVDGKGVRITAIGQTWHDTFDPEGYWEGGTASFAAGLPIVQEQVELTARDGVTRRASRVDIARCLFESAGELAVPVDVDATAPTSLRVTDSQFRGSYDRGIAFIGSELTVTACTFDNTITPLLHDPFRGADIHLGPRGPLPPEISALAGTNAHVTATHCMSSSPTFLVGVPAFFNGTDPGGALLTNIVHDPLFMRDARKAKSWGGVYSIWWGGGYKARSLVLQGCELGAPIRSDNWLHSAAVVDLGSGVEGHFVGPEHGFVTMTTPRR